MHQKESFHPVEKPDAYHWLNLIALACAIVIAFIGGFVLAGWFFGDYDLSSLGKSFIPMADETAFLFLLFGLALAFSRKSAGSRKLYFFIVCCITIIIIAATLTLFDVLNGYAWNLSDFLRQTPRMKGGIKIGEMSFLSAICFILISVALLLFIRNAGRISVIFSTLCLIIGYIIVIGYLYGVPFFYSGTLIPMAWSTAVVFIISSIGLLAAYGKETFPLKYFLGNSTRSRLMRNILPPILVLMLLQDFFDGLNNEVYSSSKALADSLIDLTALFVSGGLITLLSRSIGKSVDNNIMVRKLAEEDHTTHIRFLENLERVDKAIRQETKVENMLRSIVKEAFSIFNCDRAFLIYPCDPDADSFRVLVEITRPEYPGANLQDIDVPIDQEMARNLREALEAGEPVTYNAGTDRPINKVTAEQFGVQSQMIVPIHPRLGKPWVFGMHQCSYPRIWTDDEKKLLNEISHRISDGLSNVLFFNELRESEEHYRRIVETTQEGLCELDLSGRIIFTNQRLDQLFRYPAGEMVGLNVAEDLVFPEDRNQMTGHLQRRKEGVSGSYDHRFRTKTGEPLWLIVSHTPIKNAKGIVQGSFAMMTDITERKQAEKALRESENKFRKLNESLEQRVTDRTRELELVNKELAFHIKEIEQYTYIASHDLQEPLRTLTSFAELIHENYSGKMDEEANKSIEFIYNSAARMRDLVKGLLDYSLLGKTKVKTIVDCNKIVSAVLTDMADSIKGSNAILTVQNLPTLTGYETELRLLFQNLVNNAIKFRNREVPPIIKISAKQNEREWIFSVEDNGIGIEKKDREKIFIIFKRMHNRDEYEGTGIGLAHCKKIVELHGGKIWVESIPGKGSVFIFSLPYDKEG